MVANATARKVTRRQVGGDVFLTHSSEADGDHPSKVRLDTSFTVPSWKARIEGFAHQSTFPGTAIQVDDAWYEIVHIATSGKPQRTTYTLRPWAGAEIIRVAFELTPAACEALTRDHQEQERRKTRGAALAWFSPLVGMLPAADQERLGREVGISPAWCTALSAMILLALSSLIVMAAFALSRGMDFGDHQGMIRRVVGLSPLAAYLVIESLFRLATATQPSGTLPVVIVAQIYTALKGSVSPSEQTPSAAPTNTHGLMTARDDVRRVEGQEHDIEILSRLAKDHWTANISGIEIEGEAYILLDRQLVDTNDGPRHRFLLQKPRHEVLFKSYFRYDPTEVRTLYRDQQRLKTAMWVESVPFLWGLLEPTLQHRLAKIYNYDPIKWSRWAVNLSLAIGILLVLRSGALIAAEEGGLRDGLLLFFGIFLAWEGALRHRHLRRGEIRGSLLGLALQPVVTWFLRWE